VRKWAVIAADQDMCGLCIMCSVVLARDGVDPVIILFVDLASICRYASILSESVSCSRQKFLSIISFSGQFGINTTPRLPLVVQSLALVLFCYTTMPDASHFSWFCIPWCTASLLVKASLQHVSVKLRDRLGLKFQGIDTIRS
jgi:hypothetical protein